MRFFTISFAILSLAFLVSNSTSGQNIDRKSDDTYSQYLRNSLSSLLLKVNENNKYAVFIEREFHKTSVPEKFFENKIDPRIIKIDTISDFIHNDDDCKNVRLKILDELERKAYGKKVIEQWFNRGTDGRFDLSKFMDRGIYSASDRDYILSQSLIRGDKYLYDLAGSLVDRNYILVIAFSDIKTMDEYYQENNVLHGSRKNRGFKGEVYGLLYKIDFPEEQQDMFFRDVWIDNSTPDDSIAHRLELYKNLSIKILPDTILKVSAEGVEKLKLPEGQQPKKADVLFHDFVANAVHDLIYNIEIKKEDFKVKAAISQSGKIGINIGSKEGLEFDQRYYVYENIKDNNNLNNELVGVIRAYSISRNESVINDKTMPSSFYQTYGRKIDNLGMYAVQKNGGGNFFAVEGMYGGLRNVAVRGEFNFGKSMATSKLKKSEPINNPRVLVSLRVYIEIGINATAENGTFMTFSTGIIKDLFITRNVFISPQIGAGYDLGFKKEAPNTFQLEGGLDLGTSIGPDTRLFLTSRAFFPYTSDLRKNTPVGVGLGFRKEF